MAINVQAPAVDPLLRHQCHSHREGEWLVYTCKECPTYERRFNFKTGEMTIRPGENPHVLHQGNFQPEVFQTEILLENN